MHARTKIIYTRSSATADSPRDGSDRAHTTRLPIDFNRNLCASILYRFRDIASYLSNVAGFNPPHLHLATPYGLTPVEFRGDLWRQKTRVRGLSCGFLCVLLSGAI